MPTAGLDSGTLGRYVSTMRVGQPARGGFMSGVTAGKTRVADVADLPEGQARVVDVAGRTVAVFNVGGAFYAIDNTCPHRGGPLGEGDTEGAIVVCPWHGWRWDVRTGANTNNPAVRVACYPVTVEQGGVFVAIG
jgi:nitrite reductase (NADH) small subunit